MSSSRYQPYPEYKDSDVEWLQSVPADWAISRVKFFAALNSSKAELNHLPRNTEVTFLPMEAIGEQGELDASRTKLLSEVSSGYTFLAEGDVCIAKITPCFENGKGAIVTGLKNGIAFATTEVIPFRCGAACDSRFLYYLLTSAPFNKQAEGSMYGAGGQKRVADNFVANYHFSAPSLPEQTQIAAFLDHETAKIDRLIEKQQALIALLKEKRQAVISHAVTRGLNPSAPLKNSGIEWLGQVPEHWKILRVKTVSTFLTSGPRGWSERVGEEGSLFIQSGDLNDLLEIKYATAKRVLVGNDAETDRTRLIEGDVVVCITGAKTGNVAVVESVPETAFINQHLCLIRPGTNICPAFLGSFLKGQIGQTYFELSQYGLKQGLSLEDVKEAPVVLPPLDEQTAIVDHLKTNTSKFDSIIQEALGAVTLLQERRTALISAAVTGKIDVRPWQPPRHEEAP
ncbi:MAG: restriction endonuclease subunit S [Opitutaceae bacterium]|nr:restriction endonuclease subunit S [Opitutaceae bacterium]